jgi:hypothetical protein
VIFSSTFAKNCSSFSYDVIPSPEEACLFDQRVGTIESTPGELLTEGNCETVPETSYKEEEELGDLDEVLTARLLLPPLEFDIFILDLDERFGLVIGG